MQLGHFFRVVRSVLSISTSTMLIYRANVLFFFIFESCFTAAGFLTVGLGFSLASGPINGWSTEEAYFLLSFASISHQFFMVFFISGLFWMGFDIWSGRMDYILLKPLHPLVGMMAAHEFSISNLPNLLVSLGLFGFFTWNLGAHSVTLSPEQFVMFALLGIAAFFVRYALALACMTPAFFAERLAEGEETFWSLSSLARYPASVYPRFFQLLFTLVIPVTLIGSVPAEAFFGRLSWGMVGGYLALGGIFFVGILALFNWSTKFYQSVNSGY